MFIILLIFALFGAVAGVYYEVRRFVAVRAQKVGTVNKAMYLRDAPSMQGKQLGTLPYGTRVRILGQDPTNLNVGFIVDRLFACDSVVMIDGRHS